MTSVGSTEKTQNCWSLGTRPTLAQQHPRHGLIMFLHGHISSFEPLDSCLAHQGLSPSPYLYTVARPCFSSTPQIQEAPLTFSHQHSRRETKTLCIPNLSFSSLVKNLSTLLVLSSRTSLPTLFSTIKLDLLSTKASLLSLTKRTRASSVYCKIDLTACCLGTQLSDFGGPLLHRSTLWRY